MEEKLLTPSEYFNIVKERKHTVTEDDSDWLDKQDIDVDPSDYRGGVEIYAAPYDCAYRVLSAIQKKNK